MPHRPSGPGAGARAGGLRDQLELLEQFPTHSASGACRNRLSMGPTCHGTSQDFAVPQSVAFATVGACLAGVAPVPGQAPINRPHLRTA